MSPELNDHERSTTHSNKVVIDCITGSAYVHVFNYTNTTIHHTAKTNTVATCPQNKNRHQYQYNTRVHNTYTITHFTNTINTGRSGVPR